MSTISISSRNLHISTTINILADNYKVFYLVNSNFESSVPVLVLMQGTTYKFMQGNTLFTGTLIESSAITSAGSYYNCANVFTATPTNNIQVVIVDSSDPNQVLVVDCSNVCSPTESLGSDISCTLSLDTYNATTNTSTYNDSTGLKFSITFTNALTTSGTLKLVRFPNKSASTLNTNIATYSDIATKSYKAVIVASIDVSSTSNTYTIYDPTTRYKSTTEYGYGLFVATTDGIGDHVGNYVSTKVTKESATAIDDLYIEDETARIIAAQNSNAALNIATKTFKTIGSGGGNVYSILLLTTKELAKETATIEDTTELKNLLTKFKNANLLKTSTDSEVSSDLYQLSGIGKITSKFNGYVPSIASTLKLNITKNS